MAPPAALVPKRRKVVSPDKAVQDLVNHNDRLISSPSEGEAEAIRRLHSAVLKARAGNPDSRAEKVVKLFKDLDIVFFGGFLLGHIDVSWSGPRTFRANNLNENGTYGFASYLGPDYIQIRLSRERILSIPDKWHSFVQAWNTLLHEMAHALTMVRCGRPVSNPHGSHFRTTIHAVHRHSIQRFGLPAISSWEGKYQHNHFMSVHWALDDPSGRVGVDHHIPNYRPTTDEPHATSHRRHGKDDDAAKDKKQKKTNTENGHKNHSKTRDHGHRKHDELTDRIKAKYPQGAFVRPHGEPTCTVM